MKELTRAEKEKRERNYKKKQLKKKKTKLDKSRIRLSYALTDLHNKIVRQIKNKQNEKESNTPNT